MHTGVPEEEQEITTRIREGATEGTSLTDIMRIPDSTEITTKLYIREAAIRPQERMTTRVRTSSPAMISAHLYKPWAGAVWVHCPQVKPLCQLPRR